MNMFFLSSVCSLRVSTWGSNNTCYLSKIWFLSFFFFFVNRMYWTSVHSMITDVLKSSSITLWNSVSILIHRDNINVFKGVLHLWTLFLKTLCIFSKNKATSDKVSYGSGQKCSKELKNHSFTSVETIVVKLQWKMCKNQYFPCFEP